MKPGADPPGSAVGRARDLEADVDGDRLDRTLARLCPDLSRSRLQRLIESQHVTLDGVPSRAAARLRSGQRIRVTVPEQPPSRLEPQHIPISVIYQDDDLLVVDKPAGMTVHPSPGHPDGTLANAVLALFPGLEGTGSTIRPGIVHRLDKDTSGLMVVAKHESAHAGLARQFKERQVTKGYLALVHGRLRHAEAVIEAPLGRDRRHRQRQAAVEGGREASTSYQVVAGFSAYTLVDVRPLTGRTHQIRVHFAAVGNPIVGDATYGRSHPSLGRHFLHAHLLGFALPSSGEHVEFGARLPPELEEFLEAIQPGASSWGRTG